MENVRKYVALLVLSIGFLFFFIGSRLWLDSQPAPALSPGETATFTSDVLGFYVNFSPFITGVLITVTIAFLILIVVESIKHK